MDVWRSGEITPLVKCLLESSFILGLMSSFGIVRTCLYRFLAQAEDWDCRDIQPHGLSGFSIVRQPLFDYMDPIL